MVAFVADGQLRVFVEGVFVDREECRSMQWWTHDGYGLGWMAWKRVLVRIVRCTAG